MLGFLGGSVLKNPPANAGDLGFNPWVEKIPLEEEMATHSSILAWGIPGQRSLASEGYSPWSHKSQSWFSYWAWSRTRAREKQLEAWSGLLEPCFIACCGLKKERAGGDELDAVSSYPAKEPLVTYSTGKTTRLDLVIMLLKLTNRPLFVEFYGTVILS